LKGCFYAKTVGFSWRRLRLESHEGDFAEGSFGFVELASGWRVLFSEFRNR
jgi:hypothetical protein